MQADSKNIELSDRISASIPKMLSYLSYLCRCFEEKASPSKYHFLFFPALYQSMRTPNNYYAYSRTHPEYYPMET